MSHTPCLMGGFDSNDAGSQPFNGLARNGRSLRFTPRKIRRTRITRLKPCACSPPYVHKFNININTGDGGRRSISTGFALEILRSLHPSNHEIKDFGFVGGFSPTTWLRLQRLQFIKIILETVGVEPTSKMITNANLQA